MDIVDRLQYADDGEEMWLMRLDLIKEIERLLGINEAAYQTCNELRETNVRLRAALERIRDVPVDGKGQAYYWVGRDIAREALREGEGELMSERELVLQRIVRRVWSEGCSIYDKEIQNDVESLGMMP